MPRPLVDGLLVSGVPMYLFIVENDVRYETQTAVESYSAPLAAMALGRTEMTFKKWVRRGIIPPAIWRDTVRGFLRYTVGELQAMATVIADHEERFVYLRPADAGTINAIWQAVQDYRARDI